MPIYLDLHMVPGVSAKNVAEAHQLDVKVQDAHACKCMTYWVDEARGNVFCLIDAPDKEAVLNMHNEAHGLVPHKIIEVSSGLVESFLGRITDPEDAAVTSEGLPYFNDPSFRVLLVIHLPDSSLLSYQAGADEAKTLLARQRTAIHLAAEQQGGREAEHHGDHYIFSFTSAAKAFHCAQNILKALDSESPSEAWVRMAIHAGEPVSDNDELFGETIQLANRLCFILPSQGIAISSAVRDLLNKAPISKEEKTFCLRPPDEALLNQLFATLEKEWINPDFSMEDYGRALALSKASLYRKTQAITGFSPNELLKVYRLEKSRELLKKQNLNISQVSFACGFNSPSYFTKCFKERFGLQPMTYQEIAR